MVCTKALGAAHLLGYSLVFGSTCYQSFYAGIMAYKVLNIENFSILQNRLFPGYFSLQTVGSAFLLFTIPFAATRCHKVALGISLISSLINLAIVLPLSQRVSAARSTQAIAEGKSWRDPDISDELRTLNKKFGRLHGISVLLNFATVFSLGYYGIRLGSRF